MTKDNQRRIVFLDYMRIFAFASVLIGHKFYPAMERFVADQNNSGIARWMLELVMPLFYGGVVGVIVFFLVSGYIITHVLQSERPLEFLVKRAFRIYPLYVVAVITQTAMDYKFHNVTIPEMATMIPRLLLLGDFFSTPYSLGGVEWTLRVEILFYAYMAVLRIFRILENPNLLPWIYAATVAAIYFLPAFPSGEFLSYGYTSIYFGVLLVGSCAYLIEFRKVTAVFAIASSIMMIASSLSMIEAYQPRWSNMYFIYYGLSIFLAAIYLGRHLPDGRPIKLLSSLTFSVYLFHNWLIEYIVALISYIKPGLPANALTALPILILVCYIANRTIENPIIRIGRIATDRISVGIQTPK
ncbi:acyltransferase family protein [Pseudomonas sp. AM8]|uniref:acyltransferase family protein n=1 Tax=Pseudomonas sp. AM8 TaxID=2983368 RepID=UPI002E807E0D|nr:acyltransferase [Pseudomonas sp. AM8]